MAKDHGPSVKNDKQYEGLREKGMSKERAGGTPKLIASESGEVQAFNHLDKSSTHPVDELHGDP